MEQLTARILGFLPVAVALVLILSGVWPERRGRDSAAWSRRASDASWATGLYVVIAASLLSGVGVDMWYLSNSPSGYFQGAFLVAALAFAFSMPTWLVIFFSFRWVERTANARRSQS